MRRKQSRKIVSLILSAALALFGSLSALAEPGASSALYPEESTAAVSDDGSLEAVSGEEISYGAAEISGSENESAESSADESQEIWAEPDSASAMEDPEALPEDADTADDDPQPDLASGEGQEDVADLDGGFLIESIEVEEAPLLASDEGTVSGTCGEEANWELDLSTGTLVISGTGPMSAPTLSRPWKEYEEKIQEVRVESGITAIRGIASLESTCPNLTKVTYADTVTELGSYAFSGCTALTSFEILPTVTSIGSAAFSGCTALTSLEIPSSVTSIGSSAFSGSGLTGIVLPDTVTELGHSAFANCESLVSVTLPKGITALPDYLFKGCISLRFFSIPEGVTTVGYRVFEACTALETLELPASLTKIWDYFKKTPALKSISVSAGNSSYQSIDGVLFDKSGATLLCYPAAREGTVYEIPQGTVTVGASAFYDGAALLEIQVPASVTDVGQPYGAGENPDVKADGSYGFFKCGQLTCIEVDENNQTYASADGVLFDKSMTTLLQYPPGKTGETYQIPEGVEVIDKDAFYENPHLEQILFANTVKKMYRQAISGCSALKKLRIPPTVTVIDYFAYGYQASVDMALSFMGTPIPDYVHENMASCRMSGMTLVGCEGSAAESYADLHGITFLPGYLVSFSGADREYTSKMVVNGELYGELPSPEREGYLFDGWYTQETGGSRIGPEDTVGISENLTLYAHWTEDNNVYGSCGENASWTLNTDTGLLTIEGSGAALDGAFSWSDYREQIASVSVGEGITALGGFENCTALSSVTFSATVKEIGGSAFAGCTGLQSISLPEGIEKIGGSAFAGCTGLQSISLPEGIEEIGAEAFYGCGKLREITIPAAVQTVGGGAFHRCAALESITVEEGNTAYASADGVLFDREKTELIKYPAAKADAAYGVPGTVTKIRDYAFWDGAKLQSVVLPAGLADLGAHGFAFLKSLKTITVEDGSQTFQADGDGVLYNKEKTELIQYPAGKTDASYEAADGTVTVCAHSFYGNPYLEKLTLPPSVALVKSYGISGCERLTELRVQGEDTEISSCGYGYCSYAGKYGEAGVDIPAADEALTTEKYDGLTVTGISGSQAAGYADQEGYIFQAGYTVTFESEGETCGRAFLVPGEAYGALPAPVREGYFFNGWFTDETEDSQILEGDEFTASSDLTLYARWEKAEQDHDEGSCGETASWNFNFTTGILTVSGSGRADSGYGTGTVPWAAYTEQIREVVVEDGITFFYGLENCVGLTAVSLPSTLTELGDETFAGCVSLETVYLPASVTALGERVFAGCAALTAVTVDAGNPSYSSDGGVLLDKEQTALLKYPAGKTVIEYWLPEYVEEISAEAFSDGFTAQKIVIPEATRTIPDHAFALGKNLRSIAVDAGNTQYASADGVLFDKEKTTLLQYPSGKTEENYEIPEGVAILGSGSFYGNASLKEILLPSTLTTIRQSAIAGCENVKSLLIPETVTEIGNFAFGYDFLESDLTPDQEAGRKYQGLLVRGRLGSAAVGFAAAHGIDFSALYRISFANADETYETLVRENGETYGELPAPLRDGWIFAGWYDGEEEGEQILPETEVSLNGDQTLYARWTAIPIASLDSLTYGFGNSYSAYGYVSGRKFPLSVFTYMFGDNIIAKQLYYQHKTWGGNCFGMSSTSELFNVWDSGITVGQFDGQAALVSELELEDTDVEYLEMTLRDFIEVLHVSQFSQAHQQMILDNKNKLEALCAEVDAVQSGGGPVLVCLFGPGGGHAVVGYQVEQGDSEDRLYVYDCNFPGKERYITLGKDAAGNYVSWYYPMNNVYDWGTGYGSSFISFIPYAQIYKVWCSRGAAYQPDLNYLCVNSDYVVIQDVEENQVAEIRDGELYTDREDIIPIYEMSLAADGTADGEGTSIYLPSDDVYTLENLDGTVEQFQVSVANVDLGATVSTTAGAVTLAVNDSARLDSVTIDSQEGDVYEITLSSSPGLNDYETVELSGSALGEQVQVVQQNGELTMTNCDNAVLTLDGVAANYAVIQAEASAGGKIDPEGSQNCLFGTSLTCTITPDAGYAIKEILVDGTPAEGVKNGASETYTFENIQTGHHIQAFFERECVHSWDGGATTAEPTCLRDGVRTYTCTVCGETRTETVKGDHAFGAWTTVSPATVFAPESQQRACGLCGASETRSYGEKLQPSITVNASSIPLKTGQTTKAVKVTGLAEGDSVVSWESANPQLVKASNNGTLKAGKKTGKTTVTITLASGLKKQIKVTVQKKAVATKKITGLEKALTLKKGEKTALSPVLSPITSTDKITYASSNKKVAAVNKKGVVTAKGAGKAKIIVKSGKKRFTVQIKVY